MTYGRVPYYPGEISRIVLGVIPLPTDDLDAAFTLLDAYREAGGNIIDNSYHYGPGYSEVMRRYYAARGEDALIRLDKGSHHHYSEGRWRLTREDLEHDLLGNLARQGVTYSDFYLFHRDDPRVPVEEVVQWINEHIDAGRVKAWGGSNWSHERIIAANEAAEALGLQGMSVSSPNFSLASVNEPMWTGALTLNDEGRRWHEESGFPLFAWSAGGGGYFAGVESEDVRRVYDNPINSARRERVEALARDKGLSPAQIALAWTLSQPLNVFALVGPRTLDELAEAMAVADLRLTREECDWLEHGGPSPRAGE
jgi:aryl-alcohol dehydrogenase-like predicted oxidoreductase